MSNDNNTEAFEGFYRKQVEMHTLGDFDDATVKRYFAEAKGKMLRTWNHQQSKIDELQKAISEQREVISKLVKAVEFYSHGVERDGYTKPMVTNGHKYDIACAACNEHIGGKLARKTLKDEIVSKYIKWN